MSPFAPRTGRTAPERSARAAKSPVPAWRCRKRCASSRGTEYSISAMFRHGTVAPKLADACACNGSSIAPNWQPSAGPGLQPALTLQLRPQLADEPVVGCDQGTRFFRVATLLDRSIHRLPFEIPRRDFPRGTAGFAPL